MTLTALAITLTAFVVGYLIGRLSRPKPAFRLYPYTYHRTEKDEEE